MENRKAKKSVEVFDMETPIDFFKIVTELAFVVLCYSEIHYCPN